jgi:DNA-binding transcriptional ArsR family regulator
MAASPIFALSPRLELFFALSAVLEGEDRGSWAESVQRWLDQARRRLDQSFRRRLGEHAQTPEFWRRMAALPLPREGLAPDVESVIEAVAALPSALFQPADDPDALQLLVVDALRRFDRLAFAAYWRNWREELAADAQGIEARLRDNAVDGASKTRSAIFLPSRFAPSGFAAVDDDGSLLAFDPDRLQMKAPDRIPRALAKASGDAALIFRALGDATRYSIAGLIAREPLTSAELARRLDISKPTMAHHLRALRAAGLVGEEIQGTRIVLTLDRPVLEGVSAAAIAQLFGAAVAPIRRSRNRASAARGPRR